MSMYSTSTIGTSNTGRLLRDELDTSKLAEKVEWQKEDILKKYPLPLHWHPPSPSLRLGKLRRIIFKTLCLCSYGRPNLDAMWAAIKLEEGGDASVWTEGRRRTSEQQNSLLVVAGLLLATSAVFITTTPPDPSMLGYTQRGPYICICGAFGLLIGGIIVTSVCILVTSKVQASHTEKVLFRNTIHLYCTLIITSYPSLSIGSAILIFAFGMLAAVWSAQDIVFQVGGAILLCLPVMIGILFAISSIPAHEGEKEKD